MNQTRRNEQGFAHVLMIVIVVVVLVVVAFAGWKVMNHKSKSSNNTASNSSSSSTGNVTASGDCMSKYHDTDLCKFEAAAVAQPIGKTAFKATLSIKQDGVTSSMEFSQDGKGNSTLTTSGGDTQLNTVVVGGATYIKNGDTWLKYPSGGSAPATTDPTSDLSFLDSFNSTQFTKVGTEPCGSDTCLKYKIVDSATPDTTQYGWFDTKDYLLREWTSTDKSGNTSDMKITYMAVSISVPSPVQDYTLPYGQ